MNRFRRNSLLILVLLMGAILAVACTTQDTISSPDEMPDQTPVPTPDVEAIVQTAVRETLETIPTATPAPTPDIEAIVGTAVRETLETAPASRELTPDIEGIVEAVVREALETLTTAVAVRTEAPGPGEMPTAVEVKVPPDATESTTSDAPESVTSEPTSPPPPAIEVVEVQASPVPIRPAIAPSSVVFGRGSASPSIPALTEAGGLTVTASGSVKVAADEAYVVVVPEPFHGPGGPERLSTEDRADLVQSLMVIGIEENDIEFESGQRFEPEIISVEVAAQDLPAIGDLILDAVEDVVRRSQLSGVRFSVSEESCDQAVALARQEAIIQAERDSSDLAAALDVVRGEIIGVLEYPLTDFGNEFPSSESRCGNGEFHPYEIPLMPFDAEPEIAIVDRQRQWDT